LLKLKANNDVVNQILVAYLPETTLDYDSMYDAQLLSSSPTNLYSLLDDNSKKLAINARPVFNNSDVVQLGVMKSASVSTPMTIDLAQTEGVFSNNQTPIYLHDTALNVYHNFANGGYEFTTTALQDNDRFKIVYQNSALSNADFDSTLAFATLFENNLNIKSKIAMEQVYVYDITGRLVSTIKPVDSEATSVSTPFHQAIGVYLVKIKLNNGQIVTTKLLNR
jgi:hypothetical protein